MKLKRFKCTSMLLVLILVVCAYTGRILMILKRRQLANTELDGQMFVRRKIY